jgi:hypothetical protein
LAADLKDSSGRLCVNAIVTCRLKSAIEGLERTNLIGLEVLRLDLSGESRAQLSRQEIDFTIRHLGKCLGNAVAMKELSVRLVSFDMSMERLRLSPEAWEALIRGLGELSRHGSLRSLQLSSFAIKTSRAIQDVNMSNEDLQAEALLSPVPQNRRGSVRQLRRAATSPTRGSGAALAVIPSSPGSHSKLTFLEALAGLSNLEELTLTYDEIFGSTAQMLPPVFHKMERLRRVDLTRNHIPKQVMQAVRAAMPSKVELCGDDLQTFFFY